MPYATQVDLTGALSASSYFRTDPHWRQEALTELAQLLLAALSNDAAHPTSYEQVALDVPFYGAYCGQSALSLEPDETLFLENEVTAAARVWDHEHDCEIPLYDKGFDNARELDPYEAFLGGSLSLVSIESPLARTDRELIIFRDSFASALAPLLLGEYAKVTLVDLRYLAPERVGDYVDFGDADVLFLQSALALNAG